MSGKLVFRELRQMKEKSKRLEKIIFFNSIHATYLFLYPLKTENQRFSEDFKGYRKKPVA